MHRWPQAAPTKKISQETFDEAVATNIEDFGMDADEALTSAIEEFTVQGFDLSGIIKTKGGADLTKHEVTVSTEELSAALQESDTAGDPTPALTRLQSLFGSTVDKDALQQNLAVAHKANTVPVLLKCAARPAGSSTVPALDVLRAILVAPEARAAFTAEDGPETVMQLLESSSDAAADVQQGLWDTAEAACTKNEDNKCRFMAAGLGSHALQVLEQPSTSPHVAAAACRALRAVTSADDEGAPASKAFPHARQLGKLRSMGILRELLGRVGGEEEGVVAAVLLGLRALAANDELCKEFTDAGGVTCTLQLLEAHAGSPLLAATCCSALRQLANSDTVKKAVIEAGGLELLLRLTTGHSSNATVLEPALGLFTALLLRNPDAAARAVDAGVVEVLVDVLGGGLNDGGVLRQACMAVRNVVARRPDFRPLFLTKGAEQLLRAAKAAHPGPCMDVASAAIRDLGLDNYQDGLPA